MTDQNRTTLDLAAQNADLRRYVKYLEGLVEKFRSQSAHLSQELITATADLTAAQERNATLVNEIGLLVAIGKEHGVTLKPGWIERLEQVVAGTVTVCTCPPNGYRVNCPVRGTPRCRSFIQHLPAAALASREGGQTE